MATPADMRQRGFSLETGDNVFVYSDSTRILLQLRREVPTQQDILAPSFKTAVSLTEGEALALADEGFSRSILMRRLSSALWRGLTLSR